MTGNGLLPTINYTAPSGPAGAGKSSTGPERDRWNRAADADRFDAFLRRAQRSGTDDGQAPSKPGERPGPPAPTDRPGPSRRTRRLPPNRSDRPVERLRTDETGSGHSDDSAKGQTVDGDQPVRGTDRTSAKTDGADRSGATADQRGDGIGADPESRAASTAEVDGEADGADPANADTANAEVGNSVDRDRDESGVEYLPAVEPAVVRLPSDDDADAVAVGRQPLEGLAIDGQTIDGQAIEAADSALTDDESTSDAATDGPSKDDQRPGIPGADQTGTGSGQVQSGSGAATESTEPARSTMPPDLAAPEGETTVGGAADTADLIDTIESDDGGETPAQADGLEAGTAAPVTAGATPDRPAARDGAASAIESDVAEGGTDATTVETAPTTDLPSAAAPDEDGDSPVDTGADVESSDTAETGTGDTDARSVANPIGLPQPATEQTTGSTQSRSADGSTGSGVATDDSTATSTTARGVDPTTGVAAPVAGPASNRGTEDAPGEAGDDAGPTQDMSAIDQPARTADPNGGSTDGGGNGPATEPPPAAPAAPAAPTTAANGGAASGASTIGQMTAAQVADAGLDASALAPTTGDQADGADPLWRQIRRALGSLRTTPTGEQQLTIRLRPAELGSVVVRINSGDAGTAVSLVTESSAAANQLNQQRQQLIRDLQDGGLVDVNVDIGSDADTDRTQTGQSDGDADRTGGRGVLRGAGDSTAVDADLVRGYGARRDRGPSIGLIDVDL